MPPNTRPRVSRTHGVLGMCATVEVRATLAPEGIDRLYWLRLEAFGARAVYAVKPGPSDLERA